MDSSHQTHCNSTRPSLSVALITLNEQRVLGTTLAAVREIADEIVVVDSGSQDRTVEIAEAFGARVFAEEWKGFSEQKNSALAKCRCDWILSLDADEVITPELAEEIVQALSSGDEIQGFRVAREIHLGSRVIKRGGYYPDYQLRLVRNCSGAHFGKRAVHESIQLKATIRKLKNPLKHYAFESVEQYQESLRRYARLARNEVTKRPRLPLVRATYAFLFRYVVRLGFLEGRLGFELARVYFHYVKDKYRVDPNQKSSTDSKTMQASDSAAPVRSSKAA